MPSIYISTSVTLILIILFFFFFFAFKIYPSFFAEWTDNTKFK